MERVRDPHKVRRRNRTICILNRVTRSSRRIAFPGRGITVRKWSS
jgi:hypothetical protein